MHIHVNLYDASVQSSLNELHQSNSVVRAKNAKKYLKCVHSVRNKHRGVIKMLIGVRPRIINNEKGYIFLIIPF